ncbi:MAG: LysM peptidoglycan-binding domain-containing M23 family metallopeptidase [Treponema sp.]|jgi:murein DD-endopeptidase MepM/ murein hydrolase activator NlpD|nr:LysM peptidoglycan-binding domain-containing M23 family metallopeptidase [Treponema sp.]
MIYRHCRKRLVALVVLFWTLLSGVSAKDLVHIVTRGETVYSISRQYNVSQDALMRRNDISDPSKLFEGMKLVIPVASGIAPAAAAKPPAQTPTAVTIYEYTVKPNETLYSIARSQGVVFQALCDINKFPRNYMVKAGEKIKIPKPATAGTAASVATPAPTGTAAPSPAAVQPPAPVIAQPPIQPIAQPTPVLIMPSWAALERPSNAKPVPKNPSIRWPVSAKEIFYMNGNVGVLVTGEESESVKSLTKGTVVHASPWRGYGNVAIIEADGGYRYLYGACKTLSVRKGDNIEPGTELGKLGIYPASGKPELVFIVSHNGSPVDPVKAPRL